MSSLLRESKARQSTACSVVFGDLFQAVSNFMQFIVVAFQKVGANVEE